MFDTMGDVVAKNFLFETPQGSTHSRNLRYDINAISVRFDHFGESSDLPLDSDEALFARSLDVVSHGRYIYPYRVYVQSFFPKEHFDGRNRTKI